MNTARARLSIAAKAVTLNGAALIQHLASLGASEWQLFAEWLEGATARPSLSFSHWYRTNELHILTAWTKAAEF